MYTLYICNFFICINRQAHSSCIRLQVWNGDPGGRGFCGPAGGGSPVQGGNVCHIGHWPNRATLGLENGCKRKRPEPGKALPGEGDEEFRGVWAHLRAGMRMK